MDPLIPELLETERLRLERLHPGHEPDLYTFGLHPQVRRWLWPWPEPPTAADIHEGLTRQLAHWERQGFGLWLMRDRATGAFVGRGGLQETHAPGAPAVEVAWAVIPERWGQGLATELAHAAVATAFTELELREIVALTLPDNQASRRVMEKAGFAYERDIVHVGLPHVLYTQRDTERR